MGVESTWVWKHSTTCPWNPTTGEACGTYTLTGKSLIMCTCLFMWESFYLSIRVGLLTCVSVCADGCECTMWYHWNFKPVTAVVCDCTFYACVFIWIRCSCTGQFVCKVNRVTGRREAWRRDWWLKEKKQLNTSHHLCNVCAWYFNICYFNSVWYISFDCRVPQD